MWKVAAVLIVCFSFDAFADMPAAPRPIRRRVEPDAAVTYAIKVDGFPSEGRPDAKVTFVFVQDYADPYGDRVRDKVLPELRKKYGADLRIVYRNIVVHPRTAMAGALASCAAHKRGKFIDMDNWLWDSFKQRQLDQSDVVIDAQQGTKGKCWDQPNGCAVAVSHARKIGLPIARFKADMKACLPIVEADINDLKQFRVAAAPTFFINGRYLVGAQPVDRFISLIDEELAKANERIKAGTPRARYYKRFVLDTGAPRVDPKP